MNQPFELLYIDIFGPVRKSEYEYNFEEDKLYLLTMMDSGSRYVEIAILKNITAEETISALYNTWISRYPLPKIIHTDKGKQFLSNEFKEFAISNGIKLTTTIGDNPTGNSRIERINSTITKILRIYKGFPFAEVISLIRTSMNSLYHKGLKTSPNNLIFGINKFNTMIKYDKEKIFDISQKKTIKMQEETLERINSKRKDFDFLNKNVWVKQRQINKFEATNSGPFKVTNYIKDKGIVEIDMNDKKKWINVSKIVFVEP